MEIREHFDRNRNCTFFIHPVLSSPQPLPPLSHSSPLSLAAGDVYAIFVDPASCPSHGCLLVPQWCRARLVGEDPSGLLLMLAVDFGFTATVAPSHVSPLPQQCRGVPPQVRYVICCDNRFIN